MADSMWSKTWYIVWGVRVDGWLYVVKDLIHCVRSVSWWLPLCGQRPDTLCEECELMAAPMWSKTWYIVWRVRVDGCPYVVKDLIHCVRSVSWWLPLCGQRPDTLCEECELMAAPMWSKTWYIVWGVRADGWLYVVKDLIHCVRSASWWLTLCGQRPDTLCDECELMADSMWSKTWYIVWGVWADGCPYVVKDLIHCVRSVSWWLPLCGQRPDTLCDECELMAAPMWSKTWYIVWGVWVDGWLYVVKDLIHCVRSASWWLTLCGQRPDILCEECELMADSMWSKTWYIVWWVRVDGWLYVVKDLIHCVRSVSWWLTLCGQRPDTLCEECELMAAPMWSKTWYIVWRVRVDGCPYVVKDLIHCVTSASWWLPLCGQRPDTLCEECELMADSMWSKTWYIVWGVRADGWPYVVKDLIHCVTSASWWLTLCGQRPDTLCDECELMAAPMWSKTWYIVWGVWADGCPYVVKDLIHCVTSASWWLPLCGQRPDTLCEECELMADSMWSTTWYIVWGVRADGCPYVVKDLIHCVRSVSWWLPLCGQRPDTLCEECELMAAPMCSKTWYIVWGVWVDGWLYVVKDLIHCVRSLSWWLPLCGQRPDTLCEECELPPPMWLKTWYI